MEHINGIKDTVLIVIAGLGSVLANMFGGWDVALQVLVYVMAADYLTGLVVAGVFKRSPKSESGALESRAGFKGLVRKGGILTLVLVCLAGQADRCRIYPHRRVPVLCGE